jgi:transglutaminase/protease-like cytokinesis protein 3
MITAEAYIRKDPEEKLADKIITILKRRGIKEEYAVSKTDYGTSVYFPIYNYKTDEKLKIRISDHSVGNTYRMSNELHYNAKSPAKEIADNIERHLFPDRYKAIPIGQKKIKISGNYQNFTIFKFTRIPQKRKSTAKK